MRDPHPGVLPLRPLTVGEALDAAVVLLRVRGRRLLMVGVLVAAVEQVLLFPLRRLADVDAYYWPADDRWAAWALLVAVGFGYEAFAIGALGVPAGAAAPRALLGPAAPPPERGCGRWRLGCCARHWSAPAAAWWRSPCSSGRSPRTCSGW